MLIDMHCHSSGISLCSVIDVRQVIDRAKQNGFDGITLTNHYLENYHAGLTHDGFVDKYVTEYENALAYGKEVGMRVFFGVELTPNFDYAYHILLYGATPAFLHGNPNLYHLDSHEIYELCHANGVLVVHAHPYRNGTQPLPLTDVDGYEINCHPLHGETHASELLAIQKRENLLITCGCDYHGKGYRPRGGMILPDNITDTDGMVDYLKNAKSFDLQIHEVDEETPYRYSYGRT